MIQANEFTEIAMRAKEVRECSDMDEIAELLNSHAWLAINAFKRDGKWCFCLMRII